MGIAGSAPSPAISELVALAIKSPYYERLYGKLQKKDYQNLESLPLLPSEDYWATALTKPAELLTGPFLDGSPLGTGGSSSEPKIVLYTHKEITVASQALADAWVRRGFVERGDRILNLYNFGGMYGAHQMVNRTLDLLPLPAVHLPVGGDYPLDKSARAIERYGATVVVSPVFNITRLAAHLLEHGRRAESVRLLIFGGDPFPQGAGTKWAAAFPNARITPGQYATVEVGIIAFPVRMPKAVRDTVDPVYEVDRANILLEILDDEGAPIKEAGVRGNIFVTNLSRRLQPVIRYPQGDLGEWVDYDAKTFQLRGRGGLAVKVANTWFDMVHLKQMASKVLGENVSGCFQCLLKTEGDAAVLVFRLALPRPESVGAELGIRDSLELGLSRLSPAWQPSRDEGLIAPLQVDWVSIDELIFTDQSGKLKEVVDQRT